MRRVLKWLVIGVLGLVVVLAAAAAVLAFRGNSRMTREYTVEPAPVAMAQDEAAVARGQYLASYGCVGCHGDDLGGKIMLSDPGLGTITAPNLTAGAGGIGGTYSDTDLVRAIRHGVDKEGQPLAIMPASSFWHYSDEDLAAVIAYLRSVPAVDNDPGQRKLGPLGLVMVGAGVMDILSVEVIDHDGPRPVYTSDSSYGEYLVNTSDCRNCHGADLSGGSTGEPGAPPAADLASVKGWTQAEFLAAIRTGVTPDGRQLNPAFMPWPEYARMTDEDLATLYDYLSNPTVTVGAN
ncbi:MAG: cytochrome c [Candidatus Promineifilaceae bacterium]